MFHIKPKSYYLLLQRVERNDNTYLFQHRQVYWSFCIPSSCNPRDLQVVVAERLEATFGPLDIETIVSVDDIYCTTNNKKMNTTGWIVLYVTLYILLL